MWYRTHQPIRPLGHPGTLRLLALGLGLLSLGFGGALPMRAQEGLPDFVDEFRKALKTEVAPPRLRDEKQNRDAQDYWRIFRTKNLTKHADDLRSLGEMSKALLLQEWTTQAPDTDVRELLIKRFRNSLREALTTGTPAQLVAAAALIAESAGNARRQQTQQADLLKLFTDMMPELIDLTRNANADVRGTAAIALGQIQPEPAKAVPALENLLANDSVVPVRRAAARAMSDLIQALVAQVTTPGGPRLPIGRLGDEETLLNKLKDQWRDYSALIVKAVSSHPGAGLLDPDAQVRRNCIAACQQIAAGLRTLIPDTDPNQYPPEGRELTNEEKEKLSSDHKTFKKDFDYYKPIFQVFWDATPALARVVLDCDAETRLVARRVVDDMASARLRMRRLLESVPSYPEQLPAPKPKPILRRDANPGDVIRTASASGNVPVLLVKQQQPDKDKKAAPGPLEPPQKEALDPLLKEPPGMLTALVEGLGACDVRSRVEVLDAFEDMGDQAVPLIPTLLQTLRDPNRFVRWASARTLGRLAPRQPEIIVPALIPVLCDLEVDARAAAAAALERYGPAARQAIDALTKAVVDIDPEVDIAAMKALAAIGSEAAVAVPNIAKGLTNTNERVRRAAAEILGRFGTLAASAAQALRDTLNDIDPDVRKAASDALIRVLGK